MWFGSAAALRMRPGQRDWVLALVVFALGLLAPVTGGSAADSAGWLGAASIVGALCQGFGLLGLRSHPAVAAAVVLLGYAITSAVTGLTPPFGPWAVIWWTGSQWEPAGRGARLAALTTGVAVVLVGLAELSRPGSGATVLLVAVTLVVALSARVVRADRGRVAAVRDRAATDERLRIARDLHDVVGHGLSVVAIQSSTARLALDGGDQAAARTAIGVVEAASRTALREMRQMLGVLSGRGDDPSVDGLPGIAEIAPLVDELRAGGVPIVWESSGSWQDAPAAVQLCAYRVVQESVTNAMKHSPGRPIRVEVVAVPGMLEVSVANSGIPAPAGDSSGTSGMGLDGLRARVDAIGGRFVAGRAADGWLVQAFLPVPGQAASADGEGLT